MRLNVFHMRIEVFKFPCNFIGGQTTPSYLFSRAVIWVRVLQVGGWRRLMSGIPKGDLSDCLLMNDEDLNQAGKQQIWNHSISTSDFSGFPIPCYLFHFEKLAQQSCFDPINLTMLPIYLSLGGDFIILMRGPFLHFPARKSVIFRKELACKMMNFVPLWFLHWENGKGFCGSKHTKEIHWSATGFC